MGLLSKLLILAAFGAAAVAGVFLLGPAPQDAGPAEVALRQVRVANQPLVVGTFLDDGKAPLRAMPETEVDEGWITDAHPELIGAVIIAPLAEGKPVPRAAVLAPGQEGFLAAVLRPGHRAVSLAVDAVSGNAGHIFPGDRVDLILTQEIALSGEGESSPARRWASETILRDVRVIAVDQKLGGDLAHRTAPASPEGQTAQTSAAIARTITLEVAPEGAETIAVARNIGAISLTLRSLIVETADGAPPAPTESADRGPTWAGDVSAATRAASGVPARAPAADPRPVRPITVLRGGQQEKVDQ
jgi:pilus assembly protein CpaB